LAVRGVGDDAGDNPFRPWVSISWRNVPSAAAKGELAKANWSTAEHGEKLLILLEFFCRRDRLPTPQPIQNAVL